MLAGLNLAPDVAPPCDLQGAFASGKPLQMRWLKNSKPLDTQAGETESRFTGLSIEARRQFCCPDRTSLHGVPTHGPTSSRERRLQPCDLLLLMTRLLPFGVPTNDVVSRD
jgi:hypothetical protein